MEATTEPVEVGRDPDHGGFQPACLALQERSTLSGDGYSSHLKVRPDGDPTTPANLVYLDYDRDDVTGPTNHRHNVTVEKMHLDGSRDAFTSIDGSTPYSDYGWGHGHCGVLSYGFNRRTTLRHLLITDFHGYGVHLDAARGARVQDVHVRRCGSTIDADGNADATSRQGMHIATRSAEDDAGTSHSYGPERTIVESCSIAGPSSSGLDFAGDTELVENNVARGNYIWNTGGSCMRISGLRPRVVGNYMANSGSTMLSVSDGRGAELVGNRLYDVGSERAVSIGGQTGFTVADHYSEGGSRGLHIDSGASGSFTNVVLDGKMSADNFRSIYLSSSGDLHFNNLFCYDWDARADLTGASGHVYIDGLYLKNHDVFMVGGTRPVIDGGTHVGASGTGYTAITLNSAGARISDMTFLNVNSRCVGVEANECVVENLDTDGTESYLVDLSDGVADTRIYGDGVTWSDVNNLANATRTAINDCGRNGTSDPRSGGDWNGNGYEGLEVTWEDTGTSEIVHEAYRDGGWVEQGRRAV